MKNSKKGNSTKGGIYIAVCCFAVLAAAIGYAGRNNNSSQSKPEDYSSADIVSNNTSPSLEIHDNFSQEKSEDDIEIIVEDYISENVQKNTRSDIESEDMAVSKAAEVTQSKFLMPVEGEVVCAFSGDELIYNQILSDWRSHNGIDISCDKDSAIYASADGIVSEILDNSMGKSVLIDHKNGYVSVYSNMSEEIEVKSGDELKAGDLIGKVSDSNPSDFTKDYHLHFEILHNNEYVDPLKLLNK